MLLLARWVSDKADKVGNPEEIHLLNGAKLKLDNLRQFNRDAARQLHLNSATIPAWWLPNAMRQPLPHAMAQYFFEDAARAVYVGERSDRLKLSVKSDDRAPTICYHPDEGLWLEKPPDKKAIRLEEAGENEDGMF